MIENRIKSLEDKLESFSIHLERSKILEYVEMMNNPRRLIFVNFIGGLARGFGMAIGFTILAALVIYIIQQLVNLPLIGRYIAELLNIIDSYR
ncbi:hypothetical protein SAMN02745883_00227 [Caminicella sporogenes DSM 14501]|uniref:Signal transduction histidine kinase n=1 Tax=Caminicella sporogenes DSM 14501 TaxID=1121266 RepID=A0A1M6LJE4_9FIRM|nr:DUF5665 domain-containing protein [Caminicella sporogenes]RKD27848.1 hypothetical protein BET04_01930 [Caminicella sporogenes]SHJ71248.1 hypothetical protein SAMN02745883_00227 [Caminicella sporogenes DSM 14501]